MQLVTKNIKKLLPIIKLELYQNENIVVVSTNLACEVLTVLKNHFNFQFKVLTCISGIDYPENYYRFQIAYEILSLKFNSWLRIKILSNELISVWSINTVFLSAECWESEIWDMFGIYFINQYNLTRPLTDYGFQGFPLWKNFPLTGFTEIKYDFIKKRIVFESLEFSQEYNVFQFVSPWSNKIVQ